MTDSKPFRGQARARHRRQPRHRRGDRRSARRGRRPRHPGRSHRDRARGSRGAHPRRRRQRDHRAARPHRGREHRQARGRRRRALGEARHARAQRRDARLADAGAGHRPQGIFAAADPQPARQPGADRGLRSAAAQGRPCRRRGADLVGRRQPRAFWGAYGSSKAALETLLGAYADETATPDQGPHRRSGATRTRMRALAFPGEEPESVKPPEVVASAILGTTDGRCSYWREGSRRRLGRPGSALW